MKLYAWHFPLDVSPSDIRMATTTDTPNICIFISPEAGSQKTSKQNKTKINT